MEVSSMTTKKASKSPFRYERQNAWERYGSEKEREAIFTFAEEYREFLSVCKTERACVQFGTDLLEAQGFINLEGKKNPKPTDKVYMTWHGKALAAFIPGKRPLTEAGCSMLLAHIDSPHLDLKPHPLYEEEHMALLKTHYYGGIKKYQWTTLPLALWGTVVLENGKKVEIVLGEDEDAPILLVTDLLPHLAAKQQDGKKLSEAITGEQLNVLVGSIPMTVDDDTVKESIKESILQHLHKTYGMIEEDFISAELQLVPAGKARDVGFDRSMLGGYGHDDRVCAYAGLQALLTAKPLERSALVLWIDKEEIGSDGVTSAQGPFLDIFLEKLMALKGSDCCDKCSCGLRDLYARSDAISADVSVVLDPTYKGVHEARNTCRLGHGMIIEKYTGRGGKALASESNAEFVARVRQVLNAAKVPWQTGEIGKIDEGGGGTICKYIANRGVSILDAGVGVLSMHAPWEVISKADLYSLVAGYRAFIEGI